MKHGMIVMLGGVVKALAVAATISFAFSAQAATKKIGNNIWTYKVIKGGVQIGDGANVAVSPAPTAGTRDACPYQGGSAGRLAPPVQSPPSFVLCLLSFVPPFEDRRQRTNDKGLRALGNIANIHCCQCPVTMPIENWQHWQLATLPHWQHSYFAHFAKKRRKYFTPPSAFRGIVRAKELAIRRTIGN